MLKKKGKHPDPFMNHLKPAGHIFVQFSLVQPLSYVRLFVTPWTATRQTSLFITNSRSLLKLMSIELVMPFKHFILCRPISSQLQSFLASGSFSMSQFFTSGGQSVGVSASASVLSMNIHDWFPLGLTDLISLQSKGLSGVLSNTTVQKHQFISAQLSYSPAFTSIHDYWKNHSFDSMDLCQQSNVSAF